ncbi:hypothetical protein GQ53DRAFT_707142 [Thozetella sp. PMI_491]|nr:hypothetical protein GQ53DRAFT_707142 [Thozetella sp. PMI_491]
MAAPHGAGDMADAHKRKRDADDAMGPSSHSDRIPQPPPPQSGTTAPINYLARASLSQLRLIHGESDTFSDVLSLISDYEGVLSRRESLAANLGAKLTAPRLLRAMEGLFEGGITVHPQSHYTPTWLEVVAFAKSNPSDFNLATAADGRRTCQFVMKNCHVEIGEDDWRLIVSGTLDRFRLVPPHPLEEDEMVEHATVEILEERLQTLIVRADEVASKARQLNYHLSGRKAGISTRRSSPHPQSPGLMSVSQSPRAGVPNPGYDIRADLLQQFLAPTPPPPAATRPPSANPMLNAPPTPAELVRPRPTPTPAQHVIVQSSRPSPTQPVDSPSQQRDSALVPAEDPSIAHRGLIQARIDKLSRGDAIVPPCDRCRRLRTTCVKHLTACQGCTKKHAKCSWKGVTESEVSVLRTELLSRASASLGGGEDFEDSPGLRLIPSREGHGRLPDTLRHVGPRHPWPDEPPSQEYRFESREEPDGGGRWYHEQERDEMDVDVALRSDKGKEVPDVREAARWRDRPRISPTISATAESGGARAPQSRSRGSSAENESEPRGH